MGEEIKIIDVQVENGGTLIQVDIDLNYSRGTERLFINIKDIFKALNNYLYTKEDDNLKAMGFEKLIGEDGKELSNPNLII